MTVETKIAIGIGSALTLGFLAFKLFSNKRSKIVSLAKKEYKHWGNGSILEGDSRTIKQLRNYWTSAGAGDWSDSKMIREPWSAAFITYIYKKSNVKNFKGSVAHINYIEEAKKNKKGIKFYKPYNAFLKKGDLACYKREGGSHCDVVVDISKNEAKVIGGNVSQSVSMRTIKLTNDGRIDDTREKLPYIAVLKPN